MSKITKITNETEYEAALERVDEIFHAEGGVLGEELDALVDLIGAYEDIHYPIMESIEKLCRQRDLDKE